MPEKNQYSYACAANRQGEIAVTLGSAECLILFPENTADACMVVNLEQPIPVLLKRYRVQTLFCGGIGMCVNSLLELNGVRVIAGCSGKCSDAVAGWQKGTLQRSSNYTCADHGRTCGSCPGKF